MFIHFYVVKLYFCGGELVKTRCPKVIGAYIINRWFLRHGLNSIRIYSQFVVRMGMPIFHFLGLGYVNSI